MTLKNFLFLLSLRNIKLKVVLNNGLKPFIYLMANYSSYLYIEIYYYYFSNTHTLVTFNTSKTIKKIAVVVIKNF